MAITSHFKDELQSLKKEQSNIRQFTKLPVQEKNKNASNNFRISHITKAKKNRNKMKKILFISLKNKTSLLESENK